jgi:hypothetical protein
VYRYCLHLVYDDFAAYIWITYTSEQTSENKFEKEIALFSFLLAKMPVRCNGTYGLLYDSRTSQSIFIEFINWA